MNKQKSSGGVKAFSSYLRGKSGRFILLILTAFWAVTGTWAQTVPSTWKNVTFNENVRYSQWTIDSRIRDFYANTTQRGFNVYDENGTLLKNSAGKQKFDYVPGLVAKAILEAQDYYKAFDWSKPWFYSIQDYATENTYTAQGESGKSSITLDNMNACKMYFPLIVSTLASNEAKTAGNTAIGNVIADMKVYNGYYTIGNGASGITPETAKERGMLGGWFHKPEYTDQMWCDGLYMGPALLAQIVNYKTSSANVDDTNDWDLITKQFTISWNQLYNNGLLYHAFTATPKDDASSAWEGISNEPGNEVYHSAAYWGRACGWYFLALVDVLEQMQIAGLTSSTNYTTLSGYLTSLADGLKKYQDENTGCWYQVLDEKNLSITGNYLESSCTAIFAAAYLKAIRLNLLSATDYQTVAINAYKGTVTQFMKYNYDDSNNKLDGTVQLVHNCASAGLGGSKNRSGSREYYITGPDVAQTNTYTEGKVLGAFILAATEYEKLNGLDKKICFSADLLPSYTINAGDEIKVEATGSDNITYKWCKSDGTSIEGNPTETGTYYCMATDGTNTIKTSDTEVTVNVDGDTNDDITSSTSSTICFFSGTTPSDTRVKIIKGNAKTNSSIIYKNLSYNNAIKMESSTEITLTLTEKTKVIFVFDAAEKKFKINNDVVLTNTNNIYEKELEAGTYTLAKGDAINLYVIEFITTTISGDTTHTITYKTNGHGSLDTTTKTIESGSKLTDSYLPALTETGYTFSGWYTDEELTTEATTETVVNADMTLYAKWALNKYAVTTSCENGTIAITDESGATIASGTEVAHGTKLTFTATPADGYTFGSWSVTGTSGTENGNVYTIESLDNTTEVTATFNKDIVAGDTPIATFTLPKGIKITSPWTAEEKNGFTITSSSTIKETGNDYVKVSSGSSISLNIPENFIVTSIELDAVSSSNNTKTTVTINNVTSEIDYNAYNTATFNFKEEITGAKTLSISNSGKELHIQSVKVYGSCTKDESNSKARFTYNGSTLSFDTTTEGDETVYTTTIDVGVDKRGQSIDISAATAAEGATIAGDGYNNNNSNISITVPKIGTQTVYTYTVTSKDGSSTTKYRITVNVKKTAVVLKYEPEVFEWNKTTEPDKTFDQPTLKAYIADAEGNATTTEITPLPEGITYLSDMEDVATVDANGTITLAENGQGGVKIYAILADNDYYEAAETFFNAIITNGYSYKVTAGDKAPELNEFRYITDKEDYTGKNGNILVRMKFGGWKRNGGTYKPGTKDITDAWQNAPSKDKAPKDIASIDGYQFGFSGTNDAMDEAMQQSEEEIYGSLRTGWFKTPERDKEGNVTQTYPFTLPVRGTYMTFEPMANGMMTIYIIQNGAWNTDDNNKIKQGEFRPHAFQVVNQRGLTLKDFTIGKSKVSTKQTVTNEYYCNRDEFFKDNVYDNNSKNIARWEEFSKYLSENEKQQIADKWNSGPHGAQEVVQLDNGSYLAVQKGVVKYTFHITGHETYYFFSNFSKMGFCGANFVPDPESGQPTETLVLSDTEKFPEITKEDKGEYFDEAKKYKKYTFKFDGEERGNVDGVQAPQFKEIIVNRTFKKGQWNTLSLPFNMTQLKVEEIFGIGTQLILLNESEINGDVAKLHFVYHEIQNVLPGYPYLIKPTFKAADGNDYTDINGVRAFDEAGNLKQFTVPVKHVNPDIKQQVIDCGEYTTQCTPGYCTPTYEISSNKFSVNYKEGDIFISDNDGKLYVSAGQSYGFGYRAYISKKDNGMAAAKSIMMSYSGVEDNLDNTPTSISFTELAPEAAFTLGFKGVYNLNGQKVADTTDNLPAGIYIVNGQKIVVK